jgi:two-component system, OmpR family, sensor histidine kinase KdpD
MSEQTFGSKTGYRLALARRRAWKRTRAFIIATLMTLAAAAVAMLLQRLPHANLSLLFMTGVLIVAVRYGLWPAVYGSLLSFFVFNFFFTPPHLTLKIAEEGDVATLVFFLVMATITSNVAGRMRDAMAKREAAVRRTALLQDLTRLVAGAATKLQVAQILADKLAASFAPAVVAVAGDNTDNMTLAHGSSRRAATEPDWGDLLKTGANAAGWTLLPLYTARGRVGLVGIARDPLTPDERRDAQALIEQAAVALERTLLVRDLEEAELVSEREQLRSALLTSVSHDLKTPLASIVGAASSALAYEQTLSGTDKRILLESVLQEAERLDRYVQNLLDMMKLDQGPLQLQRDWQDLRDLVSAAARRLRLTARGFRVCTEIAEDAQIVRVHGDLVEQVFVNLLDNAARYSPPQGTITVRAAREQAGIVIEVSDEGPGIPESERDLVFDPFYRVHERDRKSGTGLGLSICRGIVRAHGGDVSANAGRNGSGARIRLTFPDAAEEGSVNG